jgi:hypothetical protein
LEARHSKYVILDCCAQSDIFGFAYNSQIIAKWMDRIISSKDFDDFLTAISYANDNRRRLAQVTSNNRYASFLLRLQWTQNNNGPAWLASIQSTRTGETRWFPNLDALVQFLREEFEECQPMQNTALPEKEDDTPANWQMDDTAWK